MSEAAQSFIAHLAQLKDSNRGALAHLKRSLGFMPGAYPAAYPYVERFVGADRHAQDPWRLALYPKPSGWLQASRCAGKTGQTARQRQR